MAAALAPAILLLLAEVTMAFSPRDRTPEQIHWEFSQGPRLFRDGAYIALTRVPAFSDPQRAPAPDFDATPRTVLIAEDELRTLWKQIEALDLGAYAKLPAEAFVALPPDAAGPERLHVAVGNQVRVDLLRESQVLIPRWRAPLLSIARQLDAAYDRRHDNPLLPHELVLRVERSSATEHAWARLVRTAGGTRAECGSVAAGAPAAAAPVRQEELELLWRWMLESRIADREFSSSSPAPATPPPGAPPGGAGATSREGHTLELRIEGHALPARRATGDFEGRPLLDQLLERLQALARP